MKPTAAAAHLLPFADSVWAMTPAWADSEEPESVPDPRRHDLPDDSALWSRLLSDVYAVDGNVPNGTFGALHGIRCLGAGLHRTRSGLRIYAGEIDRAEYRALREEYLAPHAVVIRGALARLADDQEAQVPIPLSAYR